MRNYYPGFLAALFLILLRTAIGWHFVTEGLWKVQEKDGKEFTAEGYLRASVGPLSERFRAIVPDVDAKERLRRDSSGKPIGLKEAWTAEVDRVITHYRLAGEPESRARKSLEILSHQADQWFLDPDNADKIQKYLDTLAKVEAVEQNPNALAYQREAARKARKEADTNRRELVATIDGWTSELRKTLENPDVVSEQQKTTFGTPQKSLTQLDLVNLTTKWGLTIAGACLLLGLFTPMAALGGASLLLMFYLSQPPFPGLPEPPNVEGHYLYVNKNLIELIACLVLATVPTGRWIGLDALLFSGSKRNTRPNETRQSNVDHGFDPPGSQPSPAKPDRPRGSVEPRHPLPLG